jgi:hypothetical protein
MARSATFNSWQHIHLEGNLYSSDILTLIANDGAQAQSNEAYQIPSSISLMDTIGFSYKMAIGLYEDYKFKLANSKTDPWDLTRDYVCKFLTKCLNWDIETIRNLPCEGKNYPIRRTAYNRIPVAVAPLDSSLDKPEARYSITNGPRSVSAFQLVQQYLSASGPSNWGVVANGLTIRLLRSTTALSKPQYLEFDLAPILEDDFYSEFAVLWKILHVSRIRNVSEGTDLDIWEEWRKESISSGERVRDRLRDGVTKAIRLFGTGFLRHKENSVLHEHLSNGSLTAEEYYRQILRLVYRFLFLFVTEERYSDKGIRLIFDPSSTNEAREYYEKGYSLFRLRDEMRRSRSKNLNHHDKWEVQRIVFKALEKGEPKLGLPAIGGLFSYDLCSEILDLRISNYYFLNAMEALRWARDKDGRPFWVDYRNLGTQELGSVYESLLEMVPVIDPDKNEFRFIDDSDEETTAGNARKTTGSYYTPDFLVQQLIKTAVVPVVEEKLKGSTDPEKTLLSLSIVDPACGSGHFLISAASTIAVYLSRYRDNGETVSGFRQAYRDVISHCIYGVDLNPMAVELTRMALWLEGYEPGKPLSFLDSHIKCGNSLLGVLDTSVLADGIPNDAFSPLGSDDKKLCSELKKENAKYRKYMKDHPVPAGSLYDDALLETDEEIDALSEDTTDDVETKRALYKEHEMEVAESLSNRSANLFLSAFFTEKREGEPIPRSVTLKRLLNKEQLLTEDERIINCSQEIAKENNFFNWKFEFPLVFRGGGFDIVLGNPPWDKVKIKAEEFFATRVPEIAKAQNGSKRNKMIEKLAEGTELEKRYYMEFHEAQHSVACQNTFYHLSKDDGAQYDLSGIGDVNLYALFLEMTSKIRKPSGSIGMVIPTGFCTDDSTKALFRYFVDNSTVHSIYDFENGNTITVKLANGKEKSESSRFFPAVDSRYKFSLFSSKKTKQADYAFFLHSTKDLDDERRHFTMTSDEVRLINPNTLTMPVIRSRKDFEVVKRIYSNSKAVWNDSVEGGNVYGIQYGPLFHMTNDSSLFYDTPSPTRLPLYEGKFIQIYDHRFNSYEGDRDSKGNPKERETTIEEKQNLDFELTPQYYVELDDVYKKCGIDTEAAKTCEKVVTDSPYGQDEWFASQDNLPLKDEPKSEAIGKWCFGYRSITNVTNLRTVISCIFPMSGIGHSMAILWKLKIYDAILLNANLSSIVLDYAARCKIGGTNLSQFYFKQLPVIAPNQYSDDEREFVIGYAKKLLGTTKKMAEILECPVTIWDSNERAILISRLDAFYAMKYGLSREDFEFILDPEAVMGKGYPTSTFPQIRDNDIAQYGEYRTKILALKAYDELKENGLWQLSEG